MADTDFGRFFLEESPRAAFFAAMRPWIKSPAKRRFAETQFDPFYDWYQGALGQQAMQGGIPSLNFADYLKAPQAFGHSTIDQRFRSDPFRQAHQGFLAPRTRWLLGF